MTFRPAKYLVLEPLVTTGEIGISPVLSYERRGILRSLARTKGTPSWGQPFLNHQLASATFRATSLGYRDRITFGFEELPFQLEFQAQGTVLQVISGDWQQEALDDYAPLVEALQCA
ncbi:MAG: hypothetical protein HC890_13925 [Chloroflexaceae bacterium]|nr:hypothetical protein [Chloroflexaceae bacterium]